MIELPANTERDRIDIGLWWQTGDITASETTALRHIRKSARRTCVRLSELRFASFGLFGQRSRGDLARFDLFDVVTGRDMAAIEHP